jgi:hypothetical protein
LRLEKTKILLSPDPLEAAENAEKTKHETGVWNQEPES